MKQSEYLEELKSYNENVDNIARILDVQNIPLAMYLLGCLNGSLKSKIDLLQEKEDAVNQVKIQERCI